MLCRKCGKPIDVKMNFCPYCQTKIEKQFVNTQPNNQYQQNQNVYTQPNNQYQQNQNVYTQPNNQYQQNQNVYTQPNNQYQQNQNVYTQPTNQYQQNQNMYTQPTNQYQQNIYDMNNNYNANDNNQQPKKKKNNKPLFFTIGAVVLLILLFLIGNIILNSKENNKYNDYEMPEVEKPNYDNDLTIASGTRTIMIYIVGSDLESEYGAATDDINEMLDSNFDTKDVNVVLYVGGTKEWQNYTFSENENAIYELKEGNLKKVKSYSKKRMSDPNTLTEFIDYVYQNYQTDLYSLILWDHGGGPLIGYGLDENYQTSIMSIIDIDKAINDSKLIKNTKFEFIGFDACLMGSLEIANALKEEANYLIASSENIPGDGWDYEFLKDVNKYKNTEDVGKNIIDKYYTQYKYHSIYDFDVTLSLIDLQNIDSLILAIDDLFKGTDNINNSSYSRISRGVSKAFMYGYDASAKMQTDLIDLYGLVDEIDGDQTKINKVKQEMDNSIIYHKTTIDDCHGISMYFPLTTQKNYDRYMTKNNYNQLIVSKNYLSFLNKYTDIANGNKIVKSTINDVTPESTSSEIYATIPADIAENYQAAHYLVFRKMEDGSYLPIYKSKDVSIDGNKISATVANRRISVSDLDGSNEEDVIAYEVSRDENYITYILTTILQFWEEEDFLGTFETEAVNIYFKVDRNTNEGFISDIKPIVSEDELVPKITYDLNNWLYMQFLSSSYFLYDEAGNKLEDWKSSGVMYGTEVSIKDGYKISVSELSDEDEYYYMFSIKDTQGNIYETNLVKAQ